MYSPNSRFKEIKKKGSSLPGWKERREEGREGKWKRKKAERRKERDQWREGGVQERQLTASWFDLIACAWCFSTSVQKPVGSWP